MDGAPTSSLSDIFEREPVLLHTFITDAAYLRNPPLSKIQFDFVHNLEQIFYPETYIAMVEEFDPGWTPLPMKHMLIAEWGKGGGKDSCCRLGVTRAADLLSCLKNPQVYYGLPEQDDIHLLNVAASSDQAKRAFFSPMRRLFMTNRHMMSMLRGEPPAEQSISIRLAKNIELISGHSMADTQEGLNLLVGIADEISAFKTKDELARAGIVAEGRDKKTAEGIVKMLRTSARTRFPRTFKVAQISYPRFKGDAIEQAMAVGRKSETFAQAQGRTSQYYISGPYATWEVNPRVSDPSYFQEDYDEDPEMARAMYECRPSGAINRFMRDDVAIGQVFSRVIPEPISVEYYWGLPANSTTESTLAPPEVEGWQVRYTFHEDFQPMAGALYALHGDLGITADRAGVAMSHVRTWVDRQSQSDRDKIEPRPVIRNDFTFGLEADLTAVTPDGSPAPREVQIRWYRQLVWELIARGFTVISVTFDGFQSADMIQILESRGITSEVLSLDRNDTVYQTLKDTIYDRRLEGYFLPLLKAEIESLRRLPNKKIDHPSNGSKDLADALAGSVWGAIKIGGDEGPDPQTVDTASTFVFAGSGATATELSMLDFGGGDFKLSSPSDLTSLQFGG